LLLALAAAFFAAAGPTAAAMDPGYAFARRLALDGTRLASSAKERSAHLRVAKAFERAGLETGFERFSVPGKGRSRDVIGVYDTPRSCLTIVMAHADSMPHTQGAVDNASGVGVVKALAPRLAHLDPRCDTWLVATGSEERLYTGQPDHLGALALLRRVRRQGREDDLRIALSLDEVGRGTTFDLRSSASRPRKRVERAVISAARGTGAHVRFVRDDGTGNSDHREFQLAGLPAAKLGQPGNPCRHMPCDRAHLLQPRAFRVVRRTVERLLARR
jgi:hypothetical protein